MLLDFAFSHRKRCVSRYWILLSPTNNAARRVPTLSPNETHVFGLFALIY
jgi:hypothetical protein